MNNKQLKYKYNFNELEWLARTIWGEARGEGEKGMRAVGCVIRNRVRGEGFPDTYKDVCLQPKQFSAWNEGNPNRDKMLRFKKDYVNFATAYKIASEIISGCEDITNGADHYYAEYIDLPSWAQDMELTEKFGVHKFYKS